MKTLRTPNSVRTSVGNDVFKAAGGLLRCHHCGGERELDGEKIARYFDEGWPRCCGQTMEWITDRQLDKEAPDDADE